MVSAQNKIKKLNFVSNFRITFAFVDTKKVNAATFQKIYNNLIFIKK